MSADQDPNQRRTAFEALQADAKDWIATSGIVLGRQTPLQGDAGKFFVVRAVGGNRLNPSTTKPTAIALHILSSQGEAESLRVENSHIGLGTDPNSEDGTVTYSITTGPEQPIEDFYSLSEKERERYVPGRLVPDNTQSLRTTLTGRYPERANEQNAEGLDPVAASQNLVSEIRKAVMINS